MSLSEGDRVFVNRSQTDWQPIEIVIAKVGRKWAYPLDSRKCWPGTRISVKTLELDGSRAYGRCYLSKEQWQEICEKEAEERAADAAWEDMKRKMREMWQRPAHLDDSSRSINPIPRRFRYVAGRFGGSARASTRSTISSIDQSRSVTPACIAGVTRRVLWMRLKL